MFEAEFYALVSLRGFSWISLGIRNLSRLTSVYFIKTSNIYNEGENYCFTMKINERTLNYFALLQKNIYDELQNVVKFKY